MPGLLLSETRTRTRSTTVDGAGARDRSHLAGCILWLPERSDLDTSSDDDEDDDGNALEPGCYNHPVVVLSHKPTKGKVVILILTSFGETDLATKHQFGQRVRLAHLPIKPCPRHPDNKKLLTLEDRSLRLRKNSYVKTTSKYTVPYKHLEPYERKGPVYALSRRSYRELAEYAQFRPPPPAVLVGLGGQSTGSSPLPRSLAGLEDRFVTLPRPTHIPAAAAPAWSQPLQLTLKPERVRLPKVARSSTYAGFETRYHDTAVPGFRINPRTQATNYQPHQSSDLPTAEEEGLLPRKIASWSAMAYCHILDWLNGSFRSSADPAAGIDPPEAGPARVILTLAFFFLLSLLLWSLFLYGMYTVTYWVIDGAGPALTWIYYALTIIASVAPPILLGLLTVLGVLVALVALLWVVD